MARKHREVMRDLVADIVSGTIATGQLLPRESDLADQFSVSRGVARECIRAMEERGLISVTHGKGARVNGPGAWDTLDPDVVAAMLETAASVKVLEDYLECRRVLEVEAAGMAARRARKADLGEMEVALVRMEETTRAPHSAAAEDRFLEADRAFHKAMFAATGNSVLGRVAAPIHEAMLRTHYPLARPQYRAQRAVPEHRNIYEAIRKGDPKAARQAMEKHLKTIGGYQREYAAAVAGDGTRA